MPASRGDSFYWRNGREIEVEEFKRLIKSEVQKYSWIFEGHLKKVSSFVLPLKPILLVIEEKPFEEILPSLKKDLTNLIFSRNPERAKSRILFFFANSHRLRVTRQQLIQNYSEMNSERILIWDGEDASIDELFVRLSGVNSSLR